MIDDSSLYLHQHRPMTAMLDSLKITTTVSGDEVGRGKTRIIESSNLQVRGKVFRLRPPQLLAIRDDLRPYSPNTCQQNAASMTHEAKLSLACGCREAIE